MAIPSGISGERDVGEAVPSQEFASREEFLSRFSGFITTLSVAESNLDGLGIREFVQGGREELKRFRQTLTPGEADLFEATFNLFRIKHALPPFDEVPEVGEFLLSNSRQEINVQLGGPIGVGKTTLAKPFARDINGQMVDERFKPADNPFLAPSYKDPGLMLRTQLKFLLENIKIGLGGRFHEGRWVRDTSVWSDIFVFMEWRRARGIVTEEEYDTYMSTVKLLSPLISRPDLLVMLLPSSVDRLQEGFETRMKENLQERQMEKEVSRADLETVTQSATSAVEILRNMGIDVFPITVDPVEVYERQDVRYSIVYQIRERLGILKEYLTKDPEKVADLIVAQIFAPRNEPQVVYVHSKSMFAGKTSVLTHIARKVGQDKVISFQPGSSLRYGEEQKTNMIDRDRRSIPALTIESNRLKDIVAYVRQHGQDGDISVDDKRFIFIDEVMFFIGSDAAEAIESIEELRKMGFHVVCDGIDYTFQEEPFTFAHKLVEFSIGASSWHEVEMGTKCKYCESPARGTRRLKPNGSTAHFEDQAYEAGENYEPVCCVEHKSCVGQPEGFIRQPLASEANHG